MNDQWWQQSVVATVSGSDCMVEATAVSGDRNRCYTWMLDYSDVLLCCVRRTRILLISFFLSQSMCVCVCVLQWWQQSVVATISDSDWMLDYSDDLLCCVRRTRILLISFFLSQSICVCVCVCVPQAGS